MTGYGPIDRFLIPRATPEAYFQISISIFILGDLNIQFKEYNIFIICCNQPLSNLRENKHNLRSNLNHSK